MSSDKTHCFSCKKKTPDNNPTVIIGKNNRTRLNSLCSDCGHKKSKYCKKEYQVRKGEDDQYAFLSPQK